MQHPGTAVFRHTKMIQHYIAGTMRFLITHLCGWADADVKKGSIGLGPIPH